MTKNILIPALLLTLVVTGCATGKKYGHAPVTPQAMNCGGAPAAVTLFSPAEAKLSFEDKAYTLDRIETASGVQYGNSDITYWNKGIDAQIIRKDGSTTSCTYVPRNGL